MRKKFLAPLVLTSLAVLLPIAVGLVLWDSLPEQIATNFGVDGQPNGWSSRAFAVFGIPLFVLACHIFCFLAVCFDPKQKGVGTKVIWILLAICPLVSWICAVAVYSYALGAAFDIQPPLKLFMAVVFIVLGNYMPKVRQNYTVGVKLPWTLDDPDNWNRTNRLAGWLFILAGLVWLGSAFISGAAGFYLPFAVTIAAAVAPTAYSFILYIRKTR